MLQCYLLGTNCTLWDTTTEFYDVEHISGPSKCMTSHELIETYNSVFIEEDIEMWTALRNPTRTHCQNHACTNVLVS